MKFSIKDFFSKYNQIRSKHLLKKSFMENFIFYQLRILVWYIHDSADSISLHTLHVYSTLKRRGNIRIHIVSTWNTRGVFVGWLLRLLHV